MENQEVVFLVGGWNLPNMTKGGLFVGLLLTVWERAGVAGWLVVDVWKERWVDAVAHLPVLMSRKRSSGPPWSAPRPPGPGRPWSLCPGTRVWTRHSSGRPSWPTESSGSESASEKRVGNDGMCVPVLLNVLSIP